MTTPDDAALAERLWRAWHAPATVLSYLEDETPREQQRWLRVAAKARAALGESTSMLTVRLAAEGDAMRDIAIAAFADESDPSVALRAILDMPAVCVCGSGFRKSMVRR